MRFVSTAKALSLSIALTVLFALIPQNSFSAAKIAQGQSCKVLNKVTTYKGKTFTCQKKGSKLVWSKGFSARLSAQAKPSLTPKAQTPLQKLYTDIYQRYLNASKEMSPSFNFVRCPNADPVMSRRTESAFIDAYSFWAPIYTANAKVNWLLMSEKDWDCWYETTATFEGPNSVSRQWKVWDKSTGVLGHCKVSANTFCGYGTGVREGGVFAQYNMIGSSYKQAPTAIVVHHETVHIYQMQLEADNYSTSRYDSMACWFKEGQANLFGIPIAFKGDPTSHRNVEKEKLLSIYPRSSAFTKEQWLSELNKLKTDTDFCFKNELGYSLGWFALEWTYLNFTIEEMHNFLTLIAKGSHWEKAIQTIMNMDEQTYLSKIAQYLADEI